MAMTSLSLILAAAVGFLGPEPDRLDRDEADAVVRAKIEKLRTACLWTARRKAARQLGGYRWEDRPEVVEALADALSRDPRGLVRQEAAASLGKMKPCLPVAHEALANAAENDRGPLVRHAAKRALKALSGTCVAPCDVCGSGSEEILPPLEPEPGGTIVVPMPETSLEPLEPTSFQAPFVPTSPSPFAAVDPNPAATPPRRPARPTIRLRDEASLVAPTAPVDRYALPGLPPTPIDLPAPEPGRPR